MSPDYAQPFDDSLGDASGVSPYSAEQLSLFLKDIGDFVIPKTSYYNPLGLYATGVNGTVGIRAGKAVVKGALYELDADTSLNVDAAANNRIDLIVLRFSSAGHTVRLTTIKGTAAANPSPPSITANDMRVGWYWIPSGFNPAANTIPVEDLHDERVFFPTGESANLQSSHNLLHNSEFLAYSNTASFPEGWRATVAGPPTLAAATLLTNQPRGNAVRVQSANGGIQTQVRVSKGFYTLYGTLNITTGIARVQVQDAGGALYYQDFKRTGVNQPFYIRFLMTVSEEAQIQIVGNVLGSDFKVGQLLLCQGYNPGYERHQHEIIMLDTALADASWTATAKSTGTTLIDLSASFGSQFGAAKPIRGVILRLQCNDSGSGAGAAGLYTAYNTAAPLSRLRLDREANDVMRDSIAYAPMIGGLGYTFYLGVDATGAGTLDATVEIIGIIT